MFKKIVTQVFFCHSEQNNEKGAQSAPPPLGDRVKLRLYGWVQVAGYECEANKYPRLGWNH